MIFVSNSPDRPSQQRACTRLRLGNEMALNAVCLATASSDNSQLSTEGGDFFGVRHLSVCCCCVTLGSTGRNAQLIFFAQAL